jgi:Amt family ammonium transporter
MGGVSLIYSGVSRFKNSLMPLVSFFILFPIVLGVWFSFAGNLIFPLTPKEVYSDLYILFQGLFCFISLLLLWGSSLERVSYRFIILFSLFWISLVYVPVAFHILNPDGYFYQLGIIDFAGGFTVHITSGVSALILANCIGRRLDYFNLKNKFSQPLVYVGTLFVWIGWIGFNGGSSLLLSEEGISAVINTIITPVFCLGSWLLIDFLYTPHKLTLVQISLSVVSGLVAITPGAGYLSVNQSIILGLLVGIICNISARLMHKVFKVDDVLDVFSTHGIGGIVGALYLPLAIGVPVKPNLIAVLAISFYSASISYFIIVLVRKVVNIRVDESLETSGLDLNYHGEKIVNIEP